MSEHKGRRCLDSSCEGGSMSHYPGIQTPPGPKPEIPYTGSENPGITNSRPLARSNPDLGKGNIEEGYSFRIPMGDQSDPYSG